MNNAKKNDTFNLGGFRFTNTFYPTNHAVFERVDSVSVMNGSEIRIVPCEGGVRVDVGENTGRVFPRIRNLNIVDGKPLFIVDLPCEETDYWTQQAVVFGTTEYYGMEHVHEIIGVGNGEPIYIGRLVEDSHERYHVVIHGRRHRVCHGGEGFSRNPRICSGLLVYAAQCGHWDGNGDWYMMIGCAKVGSFDEEPEIEDIMWSPRGSLENAIEWRITGVKDGNKVVQTVKLSDLDQTLAGAEHH